MPIIHVSAMEASVTSGIHGFHIYQDIWTPFIGKSLICTIEDGNRHDRYAVAVLKSAEAVCHVPCMILYTFSSFLRKCGIMKCTCSGGKLVLFKRPRTRRIGVPCRYTFKGPPHEVEKIQKFFQDAVKIEVYDDHTVHESGNFRH